MPDALEISSGRTWATGTSSPVSRLTPVTLFPSSRASFVSWIPQPVSRLNGMMEKEQHIPKSELDSFSRLLPLPYRVAVVLVAGVFTLVPARETSKIGSSPD